MVKVTTLVGKRCPRRRACPWSACPTASSAGRSPRWSVRCRSATVVSGVTVKVLVAVFEPIGGRRRRVPGERRRQACRSSTARGRDDAGRGPGGVGVRGAGLGPVQGERDRLVGDRRARRRSRSAPPRPEWATRSCPRQGWIVEGGGSRRDRRCAVAAASISSSTDRPQRNGERVAIVCSTCPVAMSIRQMSPENASSVQNDIPLGSMAMAKSPSGAPAARCGARVGLDDVAVGVEHDVRLGVRDEHVPVREDPQFVGVVPGERRHVEVRQLRVGALVVAEDVLGLGGVVEGALVARKVDPVVAGLTGLDGTDVCQSLPARVELGDVGVPCWPT